MLHTKITNLRARQTWAICLLALLACFAPSAANAQPPAPKPCFDFTGSGSTSFVTVNRNTSNLIFRILSNNAGIGGSVQTTAFGLSDVDFIAPGYFDNDNRADLNVYRTTQAVYYTRNSTSTAQNSFQSLSFGRTGDIAGLEADYDGDGRDDPTVVRDTGVGGNLNWYYLRSSNGTVGAISFGFGGFTGGNGVDTPIAGADYNGDGRAEITIIRNNPNGTDTYLAGDATTGALVLAQPWGEFDTDFYVVGDYLGDRRADFAVFRAFQGGTNGTWFVRENGGAAATVVRQFGLNSFASVGDRPICGDYNGDGKQDIAIYRSSNSSFYWLNSPGFNNFSGIQFGQPGDFPVAGLRAF